jgi:two-component system, OmpR family, response regulator MprA
MAERILVVEDEARIASFLRRGLTLEGYEVETAYDGEEALFKVRDRPPDLVILDIMLPRIDGLEVCRRMRTFTSLPVLMLTARDAVPDRVAGLDNGADDYMVKPFSLDELLARVRALLRRQKRPEADVERQVLTYGDLKMNSGTRQVWRGDREIQLTAKEYDFLELFMRNPQQVLTRDQIYERIWGYDFGGESNIIEVYVRYLRAKLEAAGEPRLIQTVRGVGYALREE